MESGPVKKRNVPATRKQHKWWSPNKKAEVVTAYLALGNAKLVEAVTKVPHGTVRAWKTEQWWKDLEAGIRDEENIQLDVRLSKIVGKTLDLLEDRLEHGDFMYDPKTSQLIRKPVNTDIVNKVSTDMFDRRKILREERKEVEVNNIQIGDHLLKLAEQFVKIAKNQREAITIEAEVISNAQEIRSDSGQDDVGGNGFEGSQDQSSQDLQCNSETWTSSGNGETQGKINEMSGIPFDWRNHDQNSSNSPDQRGTSGSVDRIKQPDQIIPGSVSGTDEEHSSPRSDSRSSGCDAVESTRSDSLEDGETVFLPNTQ